MMKRLLEQDFVSHYNREPNLPVKCIINRKSTRAKEFALKDDATMIYESGVAKYSNPRKANVAVINYESFITSLPPRVKNTGSIGKDICDLIVYTDNKVHFLLNELTDTGTAYLYVHKTYGRKTEGKISKARRQLKQSLENLIKVPSINSYIQTFSTKRCCFFSRQENAPQEISATKYFNLPNTLFVDGNHVKNPDIENRGFEYWEFYGSQTYQL
jgi:hypothetical protein